MSDFFRIDKIIVEGYGPFKSNIFTFPKKKNQEKAEIHLFTGQNGSGKSTILSIIAALVDELNQQKVRKDCSNYIEIHLSPKVDKLPLGHSAEFRNAITTELMMYTAFQPLMRYKSKVKSASETEYDFAMFAYSGSRQINADKIRGIEELTSNPLHNALSFDNSTNPNELVQWVANMKTKEALALARSDNEKATKYKESISRIEKAISKVINKSIEFVLEDDPLNVVIKYEGIHLDFGLLPDGLKSIISWMSDLLMRMDRLKWKDDLDPFKSSFILLLDEIDVHLHPEWQRQILPIVQSLFVNAQLFITTHSPFVVGSCDDVWIHNLKLENHIIEPILSEDSKSYETILKEIFGINERFVQEVEDKLKVFRILRDKMFKDKYISEQYNEELLALIKYFDNQDSIEIQSIIGAEIKQLERLLNVSVRG